MPVELDRSKWLVYLSAAVAGGRLGTVSVQYVLARNAAFGYTVVNLFHGPCGSINHGPGWFDSRQHYRDQDSTARLASEIRDLHTRFEGVSSTGSWFGIQKG